MAFQLNLLQTSSLNYAKQPQPFSSITVPTRLSSSRVNAISGRSTQELLQSGTVRPILPKDAASAMESEGYILLDIRPKWEREKARVSGSLHVPLFVEDKDNGPLTLLKKWVHFGYIGAWTGQYFTMINDDFVKEVEKEVPDKESKLLVACGEGLSLEFHDSRKSQKLLLSPAKNVVLIARNMSFYNLTICNRTLNWLIFWFYVCRSMMAFTKLHHGGYKNLGWLAGGFNRTSDSDFPNIDGTEKLQYATIGGASYYFLQLLILLQAVGKND